MRLTFTIIIGLVISLGSCKTLSNLEKKYEVDSVLINDFQKLNGTYSNRPDSIIGGIHHSPFDALNDYQRLTILDQFFWNIPELAYRDSTGQFIDPMRKWIKIEFQAKKKATISFYHNNDYLFSKNIHGKFKNGYFYMRPKIIIIPIVPILFGYNFERARIGKVGDDLIIDYTVNRWWFALAAGSSDKGMASSLYKTKMN